MWKVVKDQYKLYDKLGEGSFGIVYKAKHLVTKQVVAIKMMSSIDRDNYMTRKVLRELIILRKLSEIESNLFTTKIVDVILPKGVLVSNFENPTMISMPECSEESKEGSDSTLTNTPNEKSESDFKIDYSKLDHIFVVMEAGETDFKKLMETQPPI